MLHQSHLLFNYIFISVPAFIRLIKVVVVGEAADDSGDG